jgi:transposase
MIQITPQMRIVVAVEPADFRRGIDGLARLCKEVLKHDPFGGWVFVFRNRRATAVKVLVYDGQGFWLCHKRLSSGRFRWWPTSRTTFGRQSGSGPGRADLASGRPDRLTEEPPIG